MSVRATLYTSHVVTACFIIIIIFFPLSLLYSSLKVEYDKLANEKTEMQRHYVMVRARCCAFSFL